MTSPADELAHNRHSSCMELHQHIGDHYSQHPQQMLLSVRPEFPGSDTLYRLIDHNCAFFQAPYQFEHATAGPDPRRALLQFMIAATPDPAVAHDIVQRYDEHLAAMTSEIEHHLVGSHDVTVEKFGNVPDTVNPVPSKLAYVQVPTPDGTTKLQLVWKVTTTFAHS